jgi:NAD(P)-dependent dehydrogenase (short-subunit alcohol dehydrogenase family)
VTKRRIIVIGAASGIGLATARMAADRGDSVALIDVSATVTEVAESMGQRGFRCDIADEGAVVSAIAKATEWFGGPADAMVVAAGVFGVAPAESLSASAFHRLLDVNVVGTFVCVREMASLWMAHEQPGSIVFLSSTAGWLGDTRDPGAHYSASKGALIALTRQLSVEWAARGIRVNCVAPGIIQTPLLEMSDDDPRLVAIVRDSVPAARTGTADEVASCCLFLAGAESSYVTGAVLVVDGGLSAR